MNLTREALAPVEARVSRAFTTLNPMRLPATPCELRAPQTAGGDSKIPLTSLGLCLEGENAVVRIVKRNTEQQKAMNWIAWPELMCQT